MQRLPNPKFLFLLIFIGIIAACKKNEPLMGSNGFGLLPKSTNANFSQYVSYDANHNVLVFDSFEDVDALFEAIDEYDNNYPMDKGNTQTILDTYNKIRQYGFTMGNGNGGPNANKVKLQEFQTELLASYPLSDTVLNGLINLYDELQPSFPPPFMKTVLEANASFTFEVRENIEQCNLPVGIKNQILAKDDNTAIVPNYAYDDFLGSFTMYQSLYKVLETQQKNQLESGMSPANPLFDNDFVFDEQLRLILNTQREVYIKGNLIKLYDSCRYAIFQGSIAQAYADLARLDANGFVTTPAGIVEPASGLSLSAMNTYFPMNFATVNPNYFELKENPREGAFIELDGMDSPLSFCPQSTYNFSYNVNNPLEVIFNSTTSNSAATGTFYQYWTFGDGTGSFQTNPTHLYNQPGFYEVSLTTFNQNCGCWDVQKINIEINYNFGDFKCGYSAKIFPGNQTSEIGVWKFKLSGSFPGLNLSVAQVTINFGDGSSPETFSGSYLISTDFHVEHTYQENGEYDITASFYIYNSANQAYCNADAFLNQKLTGANNSCCKQEFGKGTQGNPAIADNFFGSPYWKLKYRDDINGKNSLFGGLRIKGWQKLYRDITEGNNKWRQRKADHKISMYGSVNELDGDEKCALQVNLVFNNGGDFIFTKNNAHHFDHNQPFNKVFGLSQANQVLIIHSIRYPAFSSSYYDISNYYGTCP
jgi:hypothetical protein